MFGFRIIEVFPGRFWTVREEPGRLIPGAIRYRVISTWAGRP